MVKEEGRCSGKSLFRSPSNPPMAFGGAPCEGDRQELQACFTGCGTGTVRQETAFLFLIPCPGWYLGWLVKLVFPHLLSCLDPNANTSCSGYCSQKVEVKWARPSGVWFWNRSRLVGFGMRETGFHAGILGTWAGCLVEGRCMQRLEE